MNSRWRNKINWVECVSERVIAASISVSRHPRTLISVYMPHSGYLDHQVEKTYDAIRRVIGTGRNMKIIGGDLNAEWGLGIGIEQASVGHYTLNNVNCRGEWMAQWVLQRKLVALNTVYKKTPQKQVTYRTPKEAEKQLDYILTDKKHCWSREAEANDMIHMGSDNRCVMARFAISAKAKKKIRLSETTPRKTGERTKGKDQDEEMQETIGEHGFEARNRDLEHEVKSAEQEVANMKGIRKKDAAAAKAAAVTAAAVSDAKEEAAATDDANEKKRKREQQKRQQQQRQGSGSN